MPKRHGVTQYEALRHQNIHSLGRFVAGLVERLNFDLVRTRRQCGQGQGEWLAYRIEEAIVGGGGNKVAGVGFSLNGLDKGEFC